MIVLEVKHAGAVQRSSALDMDGYHWRFLAGAERHSVLADTRKINLEADCALEPRVLMPAPGSSDADVITGLQPALAGYFLASCNDAIIDAWLHAFARHGSGR